MTINTKTHNFRLLNRSLAAYLGFACGDALGATLEFMTPDQIKNKYQVHKEILGGGWLRLPAGAVTDDTEMSLVLGDALLAEQGWNIKTVADHFVSWLQQNPPDIGESCLVGIRRYMNTGLLSGPENEYNAGNGACMRILPLALATLYQPEQFKTWVIEHNHFTHNNHLSDQASIMLGLLLQALIREDFEQVDKEIDQLVTSYPEFSFSPYPGKASGYIVETIQTVMHFFTTTDNFEDCLINTVNMGGDSDTTGAIVGMLAGAKYGLDAIPDRWLKTLDNHVQLLVRSQTINLLNLANKLADQSEPIENH